ncbi:MAG: HpcH/HpaI aldolase/citrate lyase family protein [Jatrophihabitantaceae bacterium]
MRHFDFLPEEEIDRLFLQPPREFGRTEDLTRLATGLGATLYSPATRPRLAADIVRRSEQGVLSCVVCLEDAVADPDLAAAERNAICQLRAYAATERNRPLLFVRIRTAEQIPMIVEGLAEHTDVLTGFVLPKFTEQSGAELLETLVTTNQQTGLRLLAMPVLESPAVIYAESRIAELLGVWSLLDKYRELVLAVRIGATDLSSAYGLRRSRETSVYDVRVLADLIADVVNIFGRADGSGWLLTGPVWEYFPTPERIFKPQLRESPFIAYSERSLRAQLIAADLDGLIREVALDKANGFVGKAVIHPSHVAPVHALLVVTHEEYCDAVDILGDPARTTGILPSAYRNKMNESKPHAAWARRVLARADVFGVARETTSFVDLLGAGLHR